MPRPGQTALIIPVPAAAALLARVAARYPDVVRPGDTGHVTVLYPFTDAAPEALAAAAAAVAPVEVVLDQVVREPGFVALTGAGLAPLTARIRAHWPDVVPYGGRFGPTPPAHLTLAMGAAEEAAADIAAMATPVRARLTELWLLRYADTWQVTGRFPLTGGSPAGR